MCGSAWGSASTASRSRSMRANWSRSPESTSTGQSISGPVAHPQLLGVSGAVQGIAEQDEPRRRRLGGHEARDPAAEGMAADHRPRESARRPAREAAAIALSADPRGSRRAYASRPRAVSPSRYGFIVSGPPEAPWPSQISDAARAALRGGYEASAPGDPCGGGPERRREQRRARHQAGSRPGTAPASPLGHDHGEVERVDRHLQPPPVSPAGAARAVHPCRQGEVADAPHAPEHRQAGGCSSGSSKNACPASRGASRVEAPSAVRAPSRARPVAVDGSAITAKSARPALRAPSARGALGSGASRARRRTPAGLPAFEISLALLPNCRAIDGEPVRSSGGNAGPDSAKVASSRRGESEFFQGGKSKCLPIVSSRR